MTLQGTEQGNAGGEASGSAPERFARALASLPELKSVEEIIRRAFRSDVQLMRDIPEYLLSLGGKRIRPVLTLLCARALGMTQASPQLLDVAAGIELIHMATLLHDDIIDNSPVRRHKPSPLATFGSSTTLLSGDFLLTRAFGLCARLDHHIVIATEEACIELVEGETLETAISLADHTLETTLTIAGKKTASLFRLSAFCAAHLSAAPAEVVKAMSRFGQSLGVAFQILDDILDVTSDEATLGKRPGLDIAERKPSAVNILWLASGAPEAKRLLEPPAADEWDFVRANVEKLRTSAVVADAKKIALEHADTAREELLGAISKTPNAPRGAADALLAVVDFAVDRVL
jgi:octaprenyl-diphosphate synthase